MSLSRVVYLSGGVGGARLAHGLARALDPERLTLIVNTGDDFTHWGLSVSPDLDTVMYTLADLGDVARGWGLATESFAALSIVERYGGETWFQLGDRDLGTHLMRSQWLREGKSLTEITATLCKGLGVRARLLPMSDETSETMIDTDQGTLTFQHWLVRARAAPDVRRVWFRGRARPTLAMLQAIEEADLLILGPSNPYVSIDPIFALPGVFERVRQKPVVAVSPIVHGQAVKGPLVRMLHTLARAEPSPFAIAAHYAGLLRGLVVERGDEASVQGVRVLGTATVMNTRERSLELAKQVLGFAEGLLAQP
ncbi:MAG TPA: 2-phospho-L-lactate transferase [Polyangiales bacterium]